MPGRPSARSPRRRSRRSEPSPRLALLARRPGSVKSKDERLRRASGDAQDHRRLTLATSRENGASVTSEFLDPRVSMSSRSRLPTRTRACLLPDGLGLKSPAVVATELSVDNTRSVLSRFPTRRRSDPRLYFRTDLAKDTDIPVASLQSGEFSVGHLVNGARAEAACPTLTDQPMSGRGGLLRFLLRPRQPPSGKHAGIHTARALEW